MSGLDVLSLHKLKTSVEKKKNKYEKMKYLPPLTKNS